MEWWVYKICLILRQISKIIYSNIMYDIEVFWYSYEIVKSHGVQEKKNRLESSILSYT